MSDAVPFVFCTERRLVELTGRRAKDLRELVGSLEEIPGASIFYHTHHQYLSHHFEKPVVYNDFAAWVSESLQERRLAEELAAIDILSFTSIRQLREAMIGSIRHFLDRSGGRSRECPPGEEFHFCKSKSFIMRTGIVAQDVPEFIGMLPTLTNTSLYFHFFEARLRLERATNDFSAWLTFVGHEKLARAIDRLDPYVLTLDELKMEIVKLGRAHLGG